MMMTAMRRRSKEPVKDEVKNCSDNKQRHFGIV
jgi:hypothetical protein